MKHGVGVPQLMAVYSKIGCRRADISLTIPDGLATLPKWLKNFQAPAIFEVGLRRKE